MPALHLGVQACMCSFTHTCCEHLVRKRFSITAIGNSLAFWPFPPGSQFSKVTVSDFEVTPTNSFCPLCGGWAARSRSSPFPSIAKAVTVSSSYCILCCLTVDWEDPNSLEILFKSFWHGEPQQLFWEVLQNLCSSCNTLSHTHVANNRL